MAFDVSHIDPQRIYGIDELVGRHGAARWEVARLLQKGDLSSPGTGTYVHRDFVPDAHDDLAVLALRCPEAIFNLHTAADLHGMNNRNLPGIYVGLPASQRVPSIGRNFVTEIIATRWSRDADLAAGVEERIIRSVTVRLTDQERTVCDMWRYSFHNPGIRGNPNRVGDEELAHCMHAYLDVNDGATSALTDMMSRLDPPRSTWNAFVQYLRTFQSAYSRDRVF
jgi:hypothetical protein